jgi:hypothetical protein
MKYQYNPSFVRDVKKTTIDAQRSLTNVIENIQAAKTINDISNLKN